MFVLIKELLLTRALLSCTQAIDTLKLRHLAFHSLRGDIHMLQGNYWNAIEDFKTATKKSINNRRALIIYYIIFNLLIVSISISRYSHEIKTSIVFGMLIFISFYLFN